MEHAHVVFITLTAAGETGRWDGSRVVLRSRSRRASRRTIRGLGNALWRIKLRETGTGNIEKGMDIMVEVALLLSYWKTDSLLMNFKTTLMHLLKKQQNWKKILNDNISLGLWQKEIPYKFRIVLEIVVTGKLMKKIWHVIWPWNKIMNGDCLLINNKCQIHYILYCICELYKARSNL